MKRRVFLALAGGAAMTWPLAPRAQHKAMRVIGLLDGGDPGLLLSELREGLRDLGYVEGQDIRIEVRSAAGKTELLRGLADELVRLTADVIVTRLMPPLLAAKDATQTIPIVMVMSGVPVEAGIIASLSRPGGNITGVGVPGLELTGKRLQLMHEILPAAHRFAVLGNAGDPFTKPFIAEIELAGRSLGLQIMPILVSGSEEFEAAFAAIAEERADAVIVQASLPAKPAIALALRQRIPLFSTRSGAVDAGALMSYAGRPADDYRQAAVYVDKILKGANPADLPVQEPSGFDLVINMRTAKALGLTVPPALLARADEVIE